MDDTTTTVIVGLPVAVTYNATLGRWTVEVDMTEFADALDEAAAGAADADAETVAAAWRSLDLAGWRADAVAEVRFVYTGKEAGE